MLTKNRALAMIVAAAAAFGHPDALSAQLANASAATLGLAGNQTAIARGFAAISVNPAGLAMPGSGFSLALAPIQVRAGIDPITLSDLVEVQGEVLSWDQYGPDWMSRINAAGGQSGTVGADLNELALTMGSIGIQLSTIVSAEMTLGPEAVQTLLWGNADQSVDYTGRDFDLEGSAFEGFAITTGALSIGKSLPSPTGAMAVGATFKYTVGHAIASAQIANGTGSANPLRIEVDMPMIHTNDEDYSPNNGSGFGIDLGFQMEQGPLHLGAAIQNVMNTFAWDESKLVYRAGTAVLESENNTSDFDSQPLSAAPAALRESIDGMKFKPTLAVGGAFDFPMALTVSADLKQRLGDGLAVGPKFNMGVGAEWRGLRIIHLRGGGSVVSGGVQYGGGASLVLGPINFTAGAAAISGDNQDTAILQFAFSLGNR